VKKTRAPRPASRVPPKEGWHGWTTTRRSTTGECPHPGRPRRAVLAADDGVVKGPVLELGCGTGRVTMPLAHAGVHVVGVDRSGEMLARARRRVRRQRRGVTPDLVRGDIRHLAVSRRDVPARDGPLRHPAVAAVGTRSQGDAVGRGPGRRAGRDVRLELVADLPSWASTPGGSACADAAARRHARHALRVGAAGQGQGSHHLRPGVRGAPGPGRPDTGLRVTFRTLSVPQMTRRLEKSRISGRDAARRLSGRPVDPRAEVWIIMARKVC